MEETGPRVGNPTSHRHDRAPTRSPGRSPASTDGGPFLQVDNHPATQASIPAPGPDSRSGEPRVTLGKSPKLVVIGGESRRRARLVSARREPVAREGPY